MVMYIWFLVGLIISIIAYSTTKKDERTFTLFCILVALIIMGPFSSFLFLIFDREDWDMCKRNVKKITSKKFDWDEFNRNVEKNIKFIEDNEGKHKDEE